MEFIYFLGRFHVLVLHIPIGIIIAIFALEWMARNEKYRHLESASAFLWIVAAVSAIVTVILGYMHFAEGAFVGPSAAQHRTFGTALGIIITVVAVLRASRFASSYKPVFFPAAILMVLLASITGHYGGNLTHGSTYLVEYAPQPIRALAGLPPRRTVESYVSADPYLDLVGPILDLRCESCHNEDKRESDLILTSYEGLMRGGETGTVVVAGRPEFSELLNRVMLPSDDESFMPAEGNTPLTEAQIAILEWWIGAGMPAETTMDQVELQPGAELESLIRRELGLSPGQ
ncbi:MAG TPA: c-type cytochrome domain-containing protein [Gammaproteobacteria bacterium]|nr:c-type cytochrome domain-containing protein [Gammaproteobacteria bacterium]